MKKIKLPKPVADLYRAVKELEDAYSRKFTLDGHLVGSLGEVIAREELGLTLHPMSRIGHDAEDQNGRQVQIKMTAGTQIAMRHDCDRLVVLHLLNPEEAEIVYDGDGGPVWRETGPLGKNGQKTISLSKLKKIALASGQGSKI